MPMRTLPRSPGHAAPNQAAPSQTLPVQTQGVDRDPLSLAQAALSRSSIYVLRKLQLERDIDGLILRGRVDSYYHKQLAQELVKGAVEGIEVVNALHVVYTPKNDYVIENR